GVDLDEDDRRLGLELAHRLVGGSKRAVDRVHEHAAEHREHADTETAPRLEDPRSASDRLLRIVVRAKRSNVLFEEGEDLAAAPGVIPGRHHIRASADDLLEQVAGDAGALGRVLAIDDDEIDLLLLDVAGEALSKNRAARFADHIP